MKAHIRTQSQSQVHDLTQREHVGRGDFCRLEKFVGVNVPGKEDAREAESTCGPVQAPPSRDFLFFIFFSLPCR